MCNFDLREIVEENLNKNFVFLLVLYKRFI